MDTLQQAPKLGASGRLVVGRAKSVRTPGPATEDCPWERPQGRWTSHMASRVLEGIAPTFPLASVGCISLPSLPVGKLLKHSSI